MLKIYSSIPKFDIADDRLSRSITDVKTVMRMCTVCLSGSLSGSVRQSALPTEA